LGEMSENYSFDMKQIVQNRIGVERILAQA